MCGQAKQRLVLEMKNLHRINSGYKGIHGLCWRYKTKSAEISDHTNVLVELLKHEHREQIFLNKQTVT